MAHCPAHETEIARIAVIGASLADLRAQRETLVERRAKTDQDLAGLRVKETKTPRDEQSIEALEQALADLDVALAALPEERRALTAERELLETTVSERSTFAFADPRDRIRHDGLQALVVGLQALTGSGAPLSVTLGSMRQRLAFAESVERSSVVEHGDAWDRAVARVSDGARYGGRRLQPQIGLVPLGPDPESNLEEFAHLQTGTIPGRDPKTKTLTMTDDSGMVFVLIPGGSFLMGAQADDPGEAAFDAAAAPDEFPPQRVSLAPFLISKYEMTQGQWLRFTGHNPSIYKPTDLGVTLQNPVEEVSWNECRRILHLLGLLLPTEAQWEYACRAHTRTRWWTGAEKESLRGAVNLADQSAARRGANWPGIDDWSDLDDGYVVHAPVGSYRANGFGLHDVHGNVYEWVRDGYFRYRDAEARPGDGLRETSSARVLEESNGRTAARGGCFNQAARSARSSARVSIRPDSRSLGLGVRPAMAITTL